jgi:hypothetical protein
MSRENSTLRDERGGGSTTPLRLRLACHGAAGYAYAWREPGGGATATPTPGRWRRRGLGYGLRLGVQRLQA